MHNQIGAPKESAHAFFLMSTLCLGGLQMVRTVVIWDIVGLAQDHERRETRNHLMGN